MLANIKSFPREHRHSTYSRLCLVVSIKQVCIYFTVIKIKVEDVQGCPALESETSFKKRIPVDFNQHIQEAQDLLISVGLVPVSAARRCSVWADGGVI